MKFKKNTKEQELEETKSAWKRKAEVTSLKKFKKTMANGYEKISPINDKWAIPIQVGFMEDFAKLLVPETELEMEGDAYYGKVLIKKGFYRTYFEKGSSVAGDYYIPELELNVSLKINDFGNQVIKKRKNGFQTYYVDTIINALDFIPEDYIEKLSDDDKIYLQAVDTASLREDLIEYLNTVPRVETPFNFALFELSKNYNLFLEHTEPVYIDVPTNQYVDADIELVVGGEVFNIEKYAVACKDEEGKDMYGFMVIFDFKDEIMEVVNSEGYKEV